MAKLRFISDPAHAWLEVPKAAVEAAGVHPGPHSHQDPDKGLYYLEEDADASLYLDAADPDAELRDVFTNYPSFVRKLPRIHDPLYINIFRSL